MHCSLRFAFTDLLVLASLFVVASSYLFGDDDGELGLSVNTARGKPDTSCVKLKNHATHFTVRVFVGTPSQAFDVVVDTGSDSLIIPSCVCQKIQSCADGPCFKGTGQSSTFEMGDQSDDVAEFVTIRHNGTRRSIPVISIEFGSGVILAVSAIDVVRIAGVHARMTDGLLLMVKNKLNFNGAFDGILGLGMPGQLSSPDSVGFLQQAGADRFSICFNDGADGILRVQPPQAEVRMGSIGHMHWGLDFRGISVGDGNTTDNRLSFCSGRSELPPGQATACGAVPDSGSTVMSAPREHLQVLYEDICKKWKRCTEYAKVTNGDLSDAFVTILGYCQSWRHGRGLDELPTLTFHLGGSEGDVHEFKLPGWGYVLELADFTAIQAATQANASLEEANNVSLEEANNVSLVEADNVSAETTKAQPSHDASSLLQHGQTAEPPSSDPVVSPDGNDNEASTTGKVFSADIMKLMSNNKNREKQPGACQPAFEEVAYVTDSNGPIWILGTPIFYQFQVNYDLETKPPSIAFVDEPCGACDDKKEALMETPNRDQTRQPRRVPANFPRRTYDFSKGL